DDLMSLNQIELAERSPPDTTCPLHDVVREAVAALAPLARQRGVDLDLQLDAPNPVIRGDRGQLVQVFVNLIDNALKYGGGSGPVEIATAAPDPGFPGMTGIAVADHGPGIAREHVPRLTERFYRVSVSESRNVGGTGLGLAIVKHVLGRHRGDLQIESTPGEGSRFTVWLPVPSEAAPHPDADDTAPQAGGNSGTVA
ncbi:MAG: two-component sensor histidine kinase, partial [Alphaproteobacteria bacterium]